jgi:hypothetical protein
MILPLRYFAERFLNCEFIHAISFDPYRIYQTRPDIIVTPNVTGSQLYYELAAAAVKQNIPVFSLVSEGNFNTDGSYDHWGYNRERRFLQEFVCCWSDRTQRYLQERVPEAKEKIVVTGNPGCDRYVIYETVSRDIFLKKHRLPSYEKVIGYAGWTFNKLRFPRGVRELLEFFGSDGSRLSWVEKQRTSVNKILRDVIRNNQDALFILKLHPQDTSPELLQKPINEMEGLSEFANVFMLGEEEALHDVIGVCDLWTCFESTTALEAWLMKKPTIFLNPEPKFKRAELVAGSAVARSFWEFQTMIDQLYSTGTISEFSLDNKAQQRQNLIAESVGYSDGFNHIRASYYFMRVVEGLPAADGPRYRFSPVQWFFHLFTTICGALYVRSIYRHLYKLKKHLWVFENYRMQELESLFARCSQFLESFYTKHRIEERLRGGTLFASLFDKEKVSYAQRRD